MISYKHYYFKDDRSIPNNPDLALIFYPQGLASEARSAEACKRLLASHHWTGAWVNGIYDYHHYHSTAHEVLAVISGSARVMLGGAEGQQFALEEGDVVVIPAGVGHCCISNSSDFRVMGAYPDGQDYDLCSGNAGERPQVLENIKKVPMPVADPITGRGGPLMEEWYPISGF